MDIKALSDFARSGPNTECACHDGRTEIEIDGKVFHGEFDGRISARLGKPVLYPDQVTSIPLHVIGYTTSSDIPGMGRTTLDFDFSRPIAPSDIRAGNAAEFFPAVQTMRLHILVTTEAFKGKTLRSMSPSALRNPSTSDFPPPVGSTYSLEAPVFLEDIANPGVSLASLKVVNTKITATTLGPAAIVTNEGFVLHAKDGRTAIGSADRSGFEVAFEIPRPGIVTLALFDEGARPLGVAFRDHRAAGRQAIRIPNGLWTGRAAYYQIAVDGLPRTALMQIE